MPTPIITFPFSVIFSVTMEANNSIAPLAAACFPCVDIPECNKLIILDQIKKMPTFDRFNEFQATVEQIKSKFPFAPRSNTNDFSGKLSDTELSHQALFKLKVASLTQDMAKMSEGLEKLTLCIEI